MFKLAPKVADFWINVEPAVPGDEQPDPFRLKVAYVRSSEIDKARESAGIPEFVRLVSRDWEGVADEAGQPLMFSSQSLNEMLDCFPQVSVAVYTAYVSAIGNAKRKN